MEAGIVGADAVNAPEPLHDADGVPMDVVVDEVVAVLEVLTLRNAIGADQDVDFPWFFGKDGGFFLGARGEEREEGLEIVSATESGFRAASAGHFASVHAPALEEAGGQVFVKIIGGVGEGGEN